LQEKKRLTRGCGLHKRTVLPLTWHKQPRRGEKKEGGKCVCEDQKNTKQNEALEHRFENALPRTGTKGKEKKNIYGYP